jgi:hypothetical protein
MFLCGPDPAFYPLSETGPRRRRRKAWLRRDVDPPANGKSEVLGAIDLDPES